MQSTFSMTTENIKKVGPGWLFGKVITGRYETESGILVVNDLKKNVNVEKIKILSVGWDFFVHGGKDCRVCTASDPDCKEPLRRGTYWAKPGDTVWVFRGSAKKVDMQDGLYAFVNNADIICVGVEE